MGTVAAVLTRVILTAERSLHFQLRRNTKQPRSNDRADNSQHRTLASFIDNLAADKTSEQTEHDPSKKRYKSCLPLLQLKKGLLTSTAKISSPPKIQLDLGRSLLSRHAV
jgi:hypothetical protein